MLPIPYVKIASFLLTVLMLAACGGEVNSATGADIESVSEVQTVENLVADEESSIEAANEEYVAEIAEESVESESTEADESADDEESPTGERKGPTLGLGNPKMKSSEAGNFDRFSGEIQVLEFFAYWCPNCKALAPRIHGLENAYSGKIKFTFLDIDDPANQVLMDEFDFYYQPLVLLIDTNGQVQKTWLGGGIDPYSIQAEIELLIEMEG